jgi:hypothetical protein
MEAASVRPAFRPGRAGVNGKPFLREYVNMVRSKWLLSVPLAAALCVASYVSAAEKSAAFQSGLHPGDRMASFLCRSVVGPDAGKPMCYV